MDRVIRNAREWANVLFISSRKRITQYAKPRIAASRQPHPCDATSTGNWRFILGIRVNPWQRSTGKSYEASLHTELHSVVIRTTPALRRNPRDDLIWILNVAGLAVHAVGRIQTDAFAVRLAGIIDHLIYVRRTEILAWAAEFLHATRIAHVRVMDHQVRRLIFLVLRARVIKVGKLIERQLAIPLGGSEQASLPPSVRGQLG